MQEKILNNPSCSYCGNNEKTLMHICYTCPMAKEVKSILKIPAVHTEKCDLQDTRISSVESQDVQNFWNELTTCWSLWQAKNGRLFTSTQLSPFVVYLDFINLLNAGANGAAGKEVALLELHKNASHTQGWLPEATHVGVFHHRTREDSN